MAVSYTNTPNYYFNLLLINKELTQNDFTIFMFINKFRNLKYKANNKRIMETLNIGKATTQTSIKRLQKFNMISTDKLQASNSNLHQVNEFKDWTLPNKHMLFTDEFNILNNDTLAICKMFLIELEYELNEKECEDIINHINNVPTKEETTKPKKEVKTIEVESPIQTVVEDNIPAQIEENEPIQEEEVITIESVRETITNNPNKITLDEEKFLTNYLYDSNIILKNELDIGCYVNDLYSGLIDPQYEYLHNIVMGYKPTKLNDTEELLTFINNQTPQEEELPFLNK